MSYGLGIDLGTTYTAAAVCRSGDVDVVTLGTHSAAVASVVYVGEDGTMLFGEAAERRAVTDPGRVVREFKRRIGDDTPVLIDGRPYPAHELAAKMVGWVVEQVAGQQGGPARRIAVTRPASWGAHKRELYREALAAQGLRVTRMAEPQAAAVGYAAAERVEPGSTIAIYDLGGGTFDATVVRKTTGSGFELLGQPEGIEDTGGIDFDELVFGHVTGSLGEAMEDLDPGDPDVLSAVARLRRDCVEAKEALSADTEATIPVLLPGVQTQVRLTRAEFEEMIRPSLERTLEALSRAIHAAGVTPGELTAVLLVGGSSRIPLVTRMVSAELGIAVAVDADPRTAIAQGAALVISDQPRHAEPDTGPIPMGPMTGPIPSGAGAAPAGGSPGGGAGGETIFGSPPPAQGPGQPAQPGQPAEAWRPAAAAAGAPPAFQRTGGSPRTGEFQQTGGFAPTGDFARTGDVQRTRPVGAPVPSPWRKTGGRTSGVSSGRIALGGGIAAIALVGALLVWPGLAAGLGLGGQDPGSTAPQSTVPGIGSGGDQDAGGQGTGSTGGGGTGGAGGGGDTNSGGGSGGAGGSGGGGNRGGQGNTGGGAPPPPPATTTSPDQSTTSTTTSTTLPETTTSSTSTTTTTTSTTLPETTTTTTTPTTTTTTLLDPPPPNELVPVDPPDFTIGCDSTPMC